MVADRYFTDTDNRVDENDVVAYAAGQRDGRHMISASVTPRAHAFFAQRARLRHYCARIASCIIRSEYANNRGYAGAREPRKRHGRYATGEAGLAASPCDMRMAIDKARQQAPAVKVCYEQAWHRHIIGIIDDRQHTTVAD